MPVDFTVAIPTYNGEQRLPAILERLRSQTGIDCLNWEIIIIDNNSKDATAKVIQEYQANWHHPYPLRYGFEAQQGAAFARLRAVREAQGALIGFLDDDNLPNSDWIAAAYSFAQEHPKAGAFGGQIHGNLEGKPPENFERIQAFLAIREHGSTPHKFEPENIRLPPGAALVVRKQAWCDSVPERPRLSGKLPGIMVQGDDYEPLLYLHKAGWEIWYNPAMHTDHQIPHWRLERDYLLSISRGCGLATCQLRVINAKPWQVPIVITRTFLGNLRRVINYRIKYRQQLKTDVVTACEMEFHFGSMLSPLVYLRRSFQRHK
ncbi:MAG: hormogonium polysaccharide biosynthesis glycosyltransferase HpsE [Kastovskya adunca ATA6-11-RM4]|jgi:glycosyltransferase involved in cell wall biosynthesis|nr:hormogonium polysaccharide biosynthesis glycosyltransferase HpsE [Kastovskya adunca ATA6-11-RM4]